MRPASGPKNAVVIGGGIVGTSTAFELATRGVSDILLLEQSTIASEASGRTGALLRRHYSNLDEAKLAQLGWLTYRDWENRIGGSCGFVPNGLVVTVDTSETHHGNVEKMYRNVESLQRLGVETEVITGDQLKALQPFLRTEDLGYVAFEPESGYVDAIAATRSMAAAASNNGVSIREGVEVTSLETTGDRISGVRTTEGDFTADIVVCAGGAWSTHLLEAVGVRLPVEAFRVQIAIVQRPFSLEREHFALVDTVAGVFARPWGPGRSLIGLAGGDEHDPVDPRTYDRRNDLDFPQRAISGVTRRIPEMASATYLHGHGCLYDMSPDAHPIIGPAGPEGLFVAAGFSGAGFKKGPAVGQCLAELITTGICETVNLSRFSIDRFSTEDWKQPWSDSEYTFTSDFGHGL